MRTISLRFGTLLATVLLAAQAPEAGAQPGPNPLNATGAVLQPPAQPRVAPAGFWTRALTVTPEWLVVENEEGQQFPIAIAAVKSYLVRLAITPNEIPPGSVAIFNALVGPTGELFTDQIDLPEGVLRAGLVPQSLTIGANGLSYEEMILFNTITERIFGRGLAIAQFAGPTYRHTVGPVVNANPIRIEIPVGQFATVLPASPNFRVYRVRQDVGAFASVAPGDWVYIVPAPNNPLAPESLVPAKMIVYKQRAAAGAPR